MSPIFAMLLSSDTAQYARDVLTLWQRLGLWADLLLVSLVVTIYLAIYLVVLPWLRLLDPNLQILSMDTGFPNLHPSSNLYDIEVQMGKRQDHLVDRFKDARREEARNWFKSRASRIEKCPERDPVAVH